MKCSGCNTGWMVIGALGLVLTNPAYAADTNGEDTQKSETPTRPLKRHLLFTPRPATEDTKHFAPATVAPRATTPAERTFPRTVSTATTLTVLSPNGGESFLPGDRVQVQWQGSGISGPGAIQLLQNGRKVADIAASVNLSEGKRSWRVPEDIKPGSYTVQIQSRDRKYSDDSDLPFSIGAITGGANLSARPERSQRPAATTGGDTGAAATPETGTGQAASSTGATPATPALGIVSPATNTGWCTNQAHEFRWSSTLPADSTVSIDLMRSDGTTVWKSIASNIPDSGSHSWAGLTDAQFSSGSISLRPRIRNADNSVVKIGEFMHFGKPLMISAPQSNHTWRKRSQYTIRWTQICALPTPATIELLNASQQPVLTIAEGLSAEGHHMPRGHEWTVPDDLAPGTYYIRVRTTDNQLSRTASFTIANPVSFPVSPSLTFTSPAVNAGWCTNLPHEFRWNTALPADARIKIDLMDANGEQVWRSIAADIPNSGTYSWSGYTDALFGFGMGTFRPRIATLDNSVITVGERFHIGKHLFLDAPKSNYTWRHGSSYDILWTQPCGLPAAVALELLDAGKQPVATLASGLTNAGSPGRQVYRWTVPGDLTPGTYYIRVRTADGQYSQESSFVISAP